MLSVEGLSFSYHQRVVLRDIAFALVPGRLVALLGINGVGKSTLLKCCNRILSPSGGKVMLEGKDITAMSRREIAARVGYVPQKSGGADISVFEMVLLGRHPHSFWGPGPADEQMVEEILYLLQLDSFASRQFPTLSGGEAQKVLIARALAQDPRVLLLDEPTSSLDLKNQLMIMELLKHLAHHHKLAVLVVVHDINLALRHCDQLLLLKDQRIRWSGEAAAVEREVMEEVYEVGLEKHSSRGRPLFVA